MENFSLYEKTLKQYQSKLPDYLQTPGSIIMNQIRLYYDIMETYKTTIKNMWSHFNVELLLDEYYEWRILNPSADDSEWKYTDLIEKLCKTYDIIREHPVELDPIENQGVGTVLKNSHMLRLLKIKVMGVGFDGSREKLEEIYNTLFPTGGTITFIFQTLHKDSANNPLHATARIIVSKPSSILLFDDVDVALFNGGYYFPNLLGITIEPYIITSTTLFYDLTNYDDDKKYDNGGL